MPPLMPPLILYKGESRLWTITVTADGVPQDITGCALEFQAKRAAGAADPPLIARSVGSGITILTQSGATLGQATISLLPEHTSGLVAGAAVYDVVAVFPSGERRYVIKPTACVIRDVVNGV